MGTLVPSLQLFENLMFRSDIHWIAVETELRIW